MAWKLTLLAASVWAASLMGTGFAQAGVPAAQPGTPAAQPGTPGTHPTNPTTMLPTNPGAARDLPSPGAAPLPGPTVPAPSAVTPGNATTDSGPLTLASALQRAQAQASVYQQAGLDEKIAQEAVKQAQAAFSPRLSLNPTIIYTSPSLTSYPEGTARPPSFLGANSIFEHQGLLNLSGELDTSGRLSAALRKSQALVEAASLGTAGARFTLAQGVEEAYYGLSLSRARTQAAQEHLTAAVDFERQTRLSMQAGEVARVELYRAGIQTRTRADELEQARASESVALETLKALLAWPADQALEVSPLIPSLPPNEQSASFPRETIHNRPELRALDAQKRGSLEDAELARAEMRPRLVYSVDGGFISPGLDPQTIAASTGVRVNVGLTIPLSDGGASSSRERQAALQAQKYDSVRKFTEQQFAQQYQSAAVLARSAWSRIQAGRESLQQAQEIYRISVARYRAGEARIVEVTDAQNVVVTQHFSLLQAINDYQVALSRLRMASGGTAQGAH